MPARQRIRRAASTTVLLAAAVGASPAHADFPDIVRARVPIGAEARSAPTIDGILDAAEWSEADRIEIHAGAEHAVLYVKNDAAHIYLALEVEDPTFLPVAEPDTLLVVFDEVRAGDEPRAQDAIGASSPGLMGTFLDLVESQAGGPRPVVTAPGVAAWALDTAAGGTSDGAGAVASDGTHTVFELAHPLRSGDGHDVDLDVAERVGLVLRYEDLARGVVLDWPAPIGESDVYASLSVTGTPSRTAVARLRELLVSAPEEIFQGSAPRPKPKRAERRRTKLLGRLAKAEARFADGRTKAAVRKLRRLTRRTDPNRRQGWLDHRHPLAAEIRAAAAGLADLVLLELPATCHSPSRGVANGVHTFLRDGFEEEGGAWTADGAWHRTSSAQLPSASCRVGDWCFRYGDDTTDDYATGSQSNAGALVSPPFRVPEGADAIVSFGTWEETEDRFITWDQMRVEYSNDGGETWEETDPVYQGQGPARWKTGVADLRGASGCLRLRFAFDTVDGKLNDGRGWMVDDVAVYGSRADVEWTKIAPANAPTASFAPVLVGDEKRATSAGPGIGRLYAFTIDSGGRPRLAAHDMERGFESWTGFPGGARLAPGSAAATSYAGRVLLVGRGLGDGLPYATRFEGVRLGNPALAAFEPVGATSIEGRPAVAANGLRFHLVARASGGRATRALLHAETETPTGPWSTPAFVADTDLGPFDPAAALGGDALHVVYVDPESQVFHVRKPEGGSFGGPVFTNQAFAIASPGLTFFHGRVHTALQLASGVLQYKHTEPDAGWDTQVSAISNQGDAPPRLVHYFGQPIIVTRGEEGGSQVVRFFRVDANLPSEPIDHLGALALEGDNGFATSVPVELAKSFGELFAAADGGGADAGSYVWAGRLLARRTFDELGVSFDTASFPECRGAPDEFPFRLGDVIANVGGVCPSGRRGFPPALSAPAGLELWNHVAYMRLAAAMWSLPWRLWTDTDVARSFQVHPAGYDVVARAGRNNATWFGVGYQDLGGYMESSLGPFAGPSYPSDGALDQEFTHALYPIPGREAAPGVFWENEAQWDADNPGTCTGAPCLCGGTRRQVSACAIPDAYAFASDYARSSEDHDFIETWYRYRFRDAQALLRERLRAGLCCGRSQLAAKYAYVRDELYEGQEFQWGRRCTPDSCPALEPCPLVDTPDWEALCIPQ